MPQSEMFGQEDISVIQTRQLRKLIHYVYHRSPYYRDLMDQARIQPADIKSLEDIRLFPLTPRQEFLSASERFLCIRPEEVAENFILSSPPEPVVFLKAAEGDLARLAYNGQLSLKVAGITEKDRVVLSLPLANCGQAGLAHYFGLRRLGATIYRVGPMLPEQFLNWLEAAQATIIISTPEFLAEIQHHWESSGQSSPSTPTRKLISITSSLRDEHFKLHPLEETLQKVWNVPILMSYHWTELLGMVCECEAGCGCHLHPELMYVEIIDAQGRSLPEGQVGELCVTMFGSLGMPLLRYRVGQAAILYTQVCTCGRWTPRIVPLGSTPA